jgi:hypothetical protein
MFAPSLGLARQAESHARPLNRAPRGATRGEAVEESKAVTELPPTKRYRWGKFQGAASLVIGVGCLLIGPFGGRLPNRLALYSVGGMMLFIGVGLLQKRHFGFILFVLMGAFVTVGCLVETGHPEAYAMIVGWWIIPAIFYYPKRWKEMR